MATSEENSVTDAEDSPDCLVNLCIQFCVQRPKCIAQYDPSLHGYLLHHHVCFPDNLSQLLFDAIISNRARHHTGRIQQLLHIFNSPLQARVQRANLQHLYISNDHMEIFLSHKPVVLNIKSCQGLSSGWSKALKEHSRNLTSLSLGTTHFLRFQGSPPLVDCSQAGQHAGRVVFSELDSSSGDSVFQIKCPNLRHLSLYGDHKYCYVPPPTLANVILRTVKNLTQLSHLDMSGCQVDVLLMGGLKDLPLLQFLGLHSVQIANICRVIEVIGQIKSLRALDLSQACKSHVRYKELCGSHPHIENLLASLPKLVWLDLSGTDLPEAHVASKDEKVNKNDFAGVLGRQFDFLGLLDCPDSPSHCPDLPARQITGDGNEEQILFALNMYSENPGLLWVALCSAFDLCRFVGIKNQNKMLQALLVALRNSHTSLKHQTLCLMTIVQVRKETYQHPETHHSTSLDRKVVLAVFDCMQECLFCEDTTVEMNQLVKKALLVLMFFEIPEDFMFCYEEASSILLNLVTRELLLGNMVPQCLYLLKRLASQVMPSQKELMGRIGVKTMLELISSKAEQGESDQGMEIAWSVIWSLTDVCPQNCERFLAEGGMDVFDMCYQKFYPDNMSLMKKIVGMMCNIAEVEYLREPLTTHKYVSCFSSLLDEELNISNSVCGVLAYLVAEGENAWIMETPSREQIMNQMSATILSWDLAAKRNVRYRTFVPILKLFNCYDSPAAQLWAAWEVCNMVKKDPARYCPMIEEEAGNTLNEVVADARTLPKVKEYLQQVIHTCQGYRQIQL